MPVARRAPRQIVGCARRSPIEKPEDAGSTPATSTLRCSQKNTRCDHRTPVEALLGGGLRHLGSASQRFARHPADDPPVRPLYSAHWRAEAGPKTETYKAAEHSATTALRLAGRGAD